MKTHEIKKNHEISYTSFSIHHKRKSEEETESERRRETREKERRREKKKVINIYSVMSATTC